MHLLHYDLGLMEVQYREEKNPYDRILSVHLELSEMQPVSPPIYVVS